MKISKDDFGLIKLGLQLKADSLKRAINNPKESEDVKAIWRATLARVNILIDNCFNLELPL